MAATDNGEKLELELKDAPLWRIAHIIEVDWRKQGKGVSPYARPYLEAMSALEDITDMYGLDTGESVVSYFLANAQTWKGPVARKVKAELRKRVGL